MADQWRWIGKTLVLIVLIVWQFAGCSKTPEGMVLIPSGTYQLGYPDYGPNEVALTRSFYIGEYEVTNQAYKTFCDATGRSYPRDIKTQKGELSYFANHPGYPVVNVSWYNAVAYCNYLSVQEGLTPCYTVNGELGSHTFDGASDRTVEFNYDANGYRLATEVEWEMAARGGLQSKAYPWGDEDPTGRANYGAIDNRGAYRSDMIDFGFRHKRGPTPVGSYAPNGYGLYDMAGNVLELCNDWWQDIPPSGRDPIGAQTGTFRVLRGGSWDYYPGTLRCASRNYTAPTGRDDGIGFRCVRRAP